MRNRNSGHGPGATRLLPNTIRPIARSTESPSPFERASSSRCSDHRVAGRQPPYASSPALKPRPAATFCWKENQSPNFGRFERNVSTVFQNYALFPHLTVAENVAFGLERRRPQESRAVIREKVDRMLGSGAAHWQRETFTERNLGRRAPASCLGAIPGARTTGALVGRAALGARPTVAQADAR